MGVMVDVLSIAKNSGSVSGTRREGSLSSGIYGLRQYFGTDDILIVKDGSSYTLTLSNGEYYVSTGSGMEIAICIPLDKTYKITKVSFDVKMTASASRYYVTALGFANATSESVTFVGTFSDHPIEKTGGHYYGDSVLITDDNWHLVSYDCNAYGNYLFFDCADYSSGGTMYFKNIKFEIAGATTNGGGATHIAKVTGQLKDLSSNLSDILIVSGGGGGGLLVDSTEYTGKEAGGISGSGDNSADQSTGNAFGQGESGTDVSGGGSGLYGGYKGTSSKSGGAGSGYIGNSLLSNKKMVGYNVPTSSAEGTKTESVNDVSASAVSGKPKAGNGHARIKFLSEPTWNVVGTWIDGKPIYEQNFDFHNDNGIPEDINYILDLPEYSHIFLGDTCWINVNPHTEPERVFPFPYVHTNNNTMVGCLFDKDSTTHKPKFCFRRGSNTVVYDVYVTIRFILA